jgi:hypothetical protein
VARASQGTVVRALHEIEANQKEENKKDDSNQLSPQNQLKPEETPRIRSSIPGYSPYIAAIVSDFSRELGDAVHEASNIKQALNLWEHSALPEAQFIDLVHEAKKLTRRYQSRPSWDAMENKMAYLFTTLRDLLARANAD